MDIGDIAAPVNATLWETTTLVRESFNQFKVTHRDREGGPKITAQPQRGRSFFVAARCSGSRTLAVAAMPKSTRIRLSSQPVIQQQPLVTLAEWLTRCPAIRKKASLGSSLGSTGSNPVGDAFLLFFCSFLELRTTFSSVFSPWFLSCCFHAFFFPNLWTQRVGW